MQCVHFLQIVFTVFIDGILIVLIVFVDGILFRIGPGAQNILYRFSFTHTIIKVCKSILPGTRSTDWNTQQQQSTRARFGSIIVRVEHSNSTTGFGDLHEISIRPPYFCDVTMFFA